MARSKFQLRYIWPIAATSLVLLGLCIALAVMLLRQQAFASESLAENVASIRAAADLEESISDLVALLRDRVEGVKALHERIDAHLELLRQAVLATRDAALHVGALPDLATDSLRSAVALARAQSGATERALAELNAV